jgi:hypothetical protein
MFRLLTLFHVPRQPLLLLKILILIHFQALDTKTGHHRKDKCLAHKKKSKSTHMISITHIRRHDDHLSGSE